LEAAECAHEAGADPENGRPAPRSVGGENTPEHAWRSGIRTGEQSERSRARPDGGESDAERNQMQGGEQPVYQHASVPGSASSGMSSWQAWSTSAEKAAQSSPVLVGVASGMREEARKAERSELKRKSTPPLSRRSGHLRVVLENERHHQVHLELDDIATLHANLLLLHPGAAYVAQRPGGTANTFTDCVLETLGRCGADLGDSCDGHSRLLGLT